MTDQRSIITRILLEEISAKKYAVGSLLPTEKELEARFGVGRHYAHYAVKNLQEWGLVVRRKKGGTVVCRLPYDFELRKCRNHLSKRVCLLNHLSSTYSYSHIHYNSRLLEPLAHKLARADLQLEIHNIDEQQDPGIYQKNLQALCEEGVQALLLISGAKHYEQLADLLFRIHDRIFVFNRGGNRLDHCILNQVSINNFADGVVAAETALSAGAQRLLFCDVPRAEDLFWLAERRRGVSTGAWRLNPERFFLDHFLLGVHGNFPLTSPSKETTLIAANDECAARYIAAGNALGLKAGRDYKIIGFGDDARYRELELTTLSPDLETIGNHLADGIISGISPGFHGENLSVTVRSKLIRRKTL